MIKYSDHIITAALRYYAEGHSRYECAERFGFTHGQIMYFAKTRGVHGGMSKERQGEYAKANQKKACEASAKAGHERVIVRDNERRIKSEFKAIEKDISDWRKTLDAYESLKAIVSSERKEFNNWLNGEYYFYKRRLVEYEPQLATCKHCGKELLFWPSHKKYGRKKPPVYCSNKCNYKHYKTGTISDRLRRRGRADEERECVTLNETIERFGGVCYLCGCETTKEDSWHDANGYFVCGDAYPTRDHIIPIDKGGKHKRRNIALACRACNSEKNNMTLREYAAYKGYGSSFLREVGSRLFASLQ